MRALFLLAVLLWPVQMAVAQVAPAESPYTALKAEVAALKAAVHGDPQRAVAEANVLLSQVARRAQSRERQLTLAAVKRIKAEAAIRTNDLAQAEAAINEAVTDLRTAGSSSSEAADVMLTKGSVHAMRGQASNALLSYQTAHRLYRQLGDQRGQGIALIYMSSLYSEARDYNTALRYLTEAIDVYRSDGHFMRAVYNNRGIALKDLGRFEEARADFSRAWTLVAKSDDLVDKAQILINIALNRVKSGQVGKAEAAVEMGLRFAEAAQARDLRSHLIAIAAEVQLRKGDRQRAADLVTASFSGVDLTRTTLPYREAHSTAYRAFRATGQSQQALAHLIALKRLDDEATKLATTTSTALMGARFDFANQELRIAKLRADELRREAVVQQAQARSERQIFIISTAATAVIIALLAFALFTVRRSSRKVQAANDDLALTNTALVEALAAKTEFLATTSHEIRTPLNGILGMTEVMLADATLTDRTRDRLGVVHGAGMTMKALVDDILDVAKMETGNLTVEAAPFDLTVLLENAAVMWAEQARAKGLEFAVRLDGAPQGMLGDAARVRQIVFNLLSNALKFTEQGALTLSARAEPDRQCVEITVEDTGIGIAPDKQSAIFESFRQADTSTTRRYGGTGLGLAICRNLANAMGGDVTVDSATGRGSTFTVTLPLTLVEPVASRDEEVQTATLLVVERNPITQSMLRTLLSSHPAEPAFVRTAADAVNDLRAGRFTHVLADDATAGDALDAIIAESRAAGAEITILWPAGREAERLQLLASGATRVLLKPVPGSQLVDAIFGDTTGPTLVSRAA